MQTVRIYGHRFYSLIKESARAFINDDMSIYASALAYHFIFSLFPFILFLIALLSFFQLGEFFGWLRQQAQFFLPPPAMELFNQAIDELHVPQKGLLSLGAITALWLASKGIRAVMTALNVVYRAKESRPAWKRYPLSIFYTFGLAVMLAIAAALLIIGPQTMSWIAMLIGMQSYFAILWGWLRWPAALFLLIVMIAIVYHFGPNVRHRFRLVSVGALISIVIWLCASLAFGIYVQNFANYSVMYGSVGAVIVLLFFLYISACALLFGAEVNAIMEQRDATTDLERK